MSRVVGIWRRSCGSFAFAWRALVATDVIYKIIAVTVFFPLVAVMLRLFLGVSGDQVRADQDILYFVLSPLGIFTLIVIAGGTIAVVAMETACLLCIARAARRRQHLPVTAAFRYAFSRVLDILRATASLVVRLLLLATPFLVVAALIAFWLVTDHDINFYLANKPPEFLLAAALIVIIVLGLAAILIRKVASWFLVLPLVLFERIRVADSFAESERRTAGQRRTIVVLVITWIVVFAASSSLLFGIVRGTGLLIADFAQNRLTLLVGALALLLFFWFAASLAVNLLANVFFALFVADRYSEWPEVDEREIAALEATDLDALGPLASRAVPIALVAVGLASVSAAAMLLRGISADTQVTITAHRGAAGHAPENTLASIKAALDMQADSVEIDVQETADGVVAVIHDSDLMKIAGVPVKVWDATYDELASHDIGSWYAPAFSNQRLTTLDEVLDLVRGKAKLTIELKYYGHDQQLEQRVIDLVEAKDMESDVVVISLKYAALQKMRTLRPDWTLGLLTARAVGDLTKLDADFLAVNVGMASRRFVRSAHSAGKQVFVWTANDAATISRMVSRGVDGLITDYPDLAREIVEQRADLGGVERLLLDLALSLGVEAAPVDIAAETQGES